MNKIFDYFIGEQDMNISDTKKSKAFIVVTLLGLAIVLILIVNSYFNFSENTKQLIITSGSIEIVAVLSLFLLKYRGVKVVGNFLSLTTVLVLLISMNIFNPKETIVIKYIHGFYSIFALLGISALFASRKVIIINTILILASTTRVYLHAEQQMPGFKDMLFSGYINNAISVIILSISSYYLVKFSEIAIKEARKATDIQEEQNDMLIKYRANLEVLVKEKTEELETTNEELTASVEELFDKSSIISEQNIELKITLDRLQETQVQLLQSEKMASLGVLLSGVAHEVNNPLNYIKGGLIGLQNYFEDNNIHDKDIDILLNALSVGVNKSANIIKSLNQFSREGKTFNDDCQISTIIDDCLLILRSDYLANIVISKDYSVNEPIIKGNTGKLHQVFMNIIINSIHSIVGKGSISIGIRNDKDTLEVEIVDTGCGIDSEYMVKITDPFFTTKEPGKGIGLGLSITYSIIENHNGTIKFVSQKNKGTTVLIKLPIKGHNNGKS